MKKKVFFTMAIVATTATMFVACENDDKKDEVIKQELVIEKEVDLGLPSGIKWTTRNVGAANPWDYGDYIAWGETEAKPEYSWETYKYANGSLNSLTKYNTKADNGIVDDKSVLEPADDAATVVLGTEYSTPTIYDWEELSSQCYWTWTSDYNNHKVCGNIVYKAKSDSDRGVHDTIQSPLYSLSDAHIFLPLAGFRNDLDLFGDGSVGLIAAGEAGFYWSATITNDDNSSARNCHCVKSFVDFLNGNRYMGESVRPVKRP